MRIEIDQKSVNSSVKYTLKYVRKALITYWIKKKYMNEILHVQCTTHDTVMPSTDRLSGINLNILVNMSEYLKLADF
jgi:hypothetical protein